MTAGGNEYNPNTKNNLGWTPLHLAVLSFSKPAVKLIAKYNNNC